VTSGANADLSDWLLDVSKYGRVKSCLGMASILGLRVCLNMRKRARRMVAITNNVRAWRSRVDIPGSCALPDGSKGGREGDMASLSSGLGGLGRSTGMMRDGYVGYVCFDCPTIMYQIAGRRAVD